MTDLFSHEAALKLAWSLEDRGIRLRFDGTHLHLTPATALTPTDLVACRLHRRALTHLLSKLLDLFQQQDGALGGLAPSCLAPDPSRPDHFPPPYSATQDT